MANEIDIKNANEKLIGAINAGLRGDGNVGLYSENAMNVLKDSKTDEHPLIDIHSTNDTKANALHGMAALGAPKTFKAFLDAGLDINSKDDLGDTPLHKITLEKALASPETYANIVKIAMDSGADLNIKNNAGVSALEHITGLQKGMKDYLKAEKEAIPEKAKESVADFREKNSDLLSDIVAGGDDLKIVKSKLEADLLKKEEALKPFSELPSKVKPAITLEEAHGRLDSGLPESQVPNTPTNQR